VPAESLAKTLLVVKRPLAYKVYIKSAAFIAFTSVVGSFDPDATSTMFFCGLCYHIKRQEWDFNQKISVLN
jgi:hypothetical protein